MLVPTAGSAAILHVEANGSGDFPTIQAAMDAAVAGDIVLLGPGTYRAVVSRNVDTRNARSIVFMKSAVTLQGAQGAALTILDGENDHHCLVGEDLAATTLVRGITLLDGKSSGSGGNNNWGGCALAYRSAVVFQDCVFQGGQAIGGAALLFFASGPTPGPIVRSCVFQASHSTQLGGAIEIYQANAFLFQNNTFVANTAADNGGAVLINGATGRVDNNIFWSNTATNYGGAVSCIYNTTVQGSCNLFWQNTAPGTPNVYVCSIPVGSNGNLEVDPLFCDATGGDFRLQSGSPGAPAHSGTCGLIGALAVGCGPPPTTANLVIPELTGEHGTSVTVPILLQGSAPSGVKSYQADLAFDPNIVAYVSVETAGTLSDGRLVVGNSPQPGRLLLAAAGTSPLGDHGTLVNVVFAISPGAVNGTRSPVGFNSFLWGEGIAETSLAGGGITVGNSLFAGGHVSYYASARPVPDTSLEIQGAVHTTATSDSTGAYTFSGLWYGAAFTITPTYANEAIDAVSALDASLVLQSLVQLVSLTPQQQVAADLTGDGTVSAEDASKILIMVVGGPGSLPSPLWLFTPASAHVDSLAAPLANVDFVGTLRGDVTGNWCPTNPCPLRQRGSDVAWSGSGVWNDGSFALTFRLDGAGARGVDFRLLYDANNLTFLGAETQGAGLWQTSATSGQLAVAGATAVPWRAGEAAVVARFAPVRTPARRTQVQISSLRIDEGPAQSRSVEVPGILTPREGLADFDVSILPNPARSQVTLSIVGATAPVQLDVFDVAGRRIRAFGVTPDASGSGTMTWDRRDGAGSSVANGIYFMRATTGQRVVTKRIVVMR